MIAVSDMGWGPWWDADARLREADAEAEAARRRELAEADHREALFEHEHRARVAKAQRRIALRQAIRDALQAAAAVPDPVPRGTAPVQAPDLHKQVAAWARETGGDVPSIKKIRERYGVGTPRATKAQEQARVVLAEQ